MSPRTCFYKATPQSGWWIKLGANIFELWIEIRNFRLTHWVEGGRG